MIHSLFKSLKESDEALHHTHEPFSRAEDGSAMPARLPSEGPVVDVLVCDVSGSMKEDGFETGRSKLELLCEAIAGFLSVKVESRPQDHVALVAYDYMGTCLCPL